jgi:hypothetical protein
MFNTRRQMLQLKQWLCQTFFLPVSAMYVFQFIRTILVRLSDNNNDEQIRLLTNVHHASFDNHK